MSNPPYILLVDDDLPVLRFMQEALEEGGYEVTATTSGTSALAIIKERLPDLLILDLNMPEPDGFDILKTERSQFPDLKILVISGYLTGVLLDAATFVGAIGTIEKPFAPDALVAKVRDALEK
jgi:DNA-binding NtrC family response regulator